MTYIAAADFRLGTAQSWTANLLLGEQDGSDAAIDGAIAAMTTQVELDLQDDFEPRDPDIDQTLEVEGWGRSRLYVPRRVRSLTTVKTRGPDGTLTTVASSAYRLRQSLDMTTSPAGAAMMDGQRLDYLDHLSTTWPEATNAVQLVGKFGWGAVPVDIKRLVALRVYDLIRAAGDPLSRITQRATVDAVITYGESAEERDIVDRYTRDLPVTIG